MPSSGSSPPSYHSKPGSQEERLLPQHSSSYPSKLDVDTDNKSTKSRSFVDKPSADLASLKSISGGRVRKGKCPPEFLAEVSKAGLPQSVLEKYGAGKFKVVVGKEALELYERYIGKKNNYPPSQLYEEGIANKLLPPLVFAVPVYDAVGRKCVDYYMSWRRIQARVTNSQPPPPRVYDVPEAERRCSFLDGEFKLLGSTLDKEYKKARRAATSSRASSGSIKSTSSSRKGDRIYQLKENVAPSSPRKRPSPPPEVVVPEPTVAVPESPVSANASVISIPTLTQIRGVPRSHHLPLRVANPDPETSTIDEEPEHASRSLETLVETAENAGPSNQNAASDETLVHQIPSRAVPPVVVRPPSSDAGSSDRSSRSSRSSGSRESRRHRDRDHDDRHRHDSSRRHSSRERDSDRHHEKKHSSKHDDSRRKKASPMGDEEFIIVVLDEKLTNGVTWHGIDRQKSIPRSPSRAPSARQSPWNGPLAQQDFITRRYTLQRPHDHSPHDSGESEGESSDSDVDGYDDAPVIPLKAYMEASGMVAPASQASYPVVAVSPMQYQQQRPLVVTNFTPQSYTQSPPSTVYGSPYPMANPSLQSSPYVSAWMKLTPQQQHTPLVHSPYSVASQPIYASPYGQPHPVAPY